MRLLSVVWKLLRVRWWIFLSSLRRAKGRRLFGYIISLLVTFIFIVGAFSVSWLIFSLMQDPYLASATGAQSLENIPVTVLSGAFVIVFLLSFQVLLQGLYLSGDIDFLLSVPIPARAVFVAKLIEAILPNFTFLAALMLPMLWGLGASGRYNLLYYPLTVVLLALQALAAAGLSAMLVMAITRVFPARRIFEVVSFVGAILGMWCSQWYNLSRAFSDNRAPDMLPSFLRTAGALGRFHSPWLPLAWPGLGLLALARGRWLPALGYLALNGSACIGIFLVALTMAERLYYSGWAKMRAAPARQRRRATLPRERRAGHIPFLPPPVGGILLKDLRMLRRDLRNLSQLISPIIFALLYAVMFLSRGSTFREGILSMGIAQFAVYGTILITLFACWGLASRLALVSFSLEGRHYWILRAAPISAGQLTLAKWLAAFLPTIGVGTVLIVGIGAAQRATPGDIFFGWCTIAFIAAGNVGLNLAFGITGARLDWTDPHRMAANTSGCLVTLLNLGFQSVSVMLFLGPPIAAGTLNLSPIAGQLVGFGLGGTLCVLVAILPPWLVHKCVLTLGESPT